MSLYTCEAHDDCVVVFETTRRGRADCPMCSAIEELESDLAVCREDLETVAIVDADDDMRRMFDFFGELEELLRDLRYGGSVDSEDVGELVEKHWSASGPGVGGCWTRVLYGMDVLLKNCTDPDADTLEWRPDIQAWLDSQEETT